MAEYVVRRRKLGGTTMVYIIKLDSDYQWTHLQRRAWRWRTRNAAAAVALALDADVVRLVPKRRAQVSQDSSTPSNQTAAGAPAPASGEPERAAPMKSCGTCGAVYHPSVEHGSDACRAVFCAGLSRLLAEPTQPGVIRWLCTPQYSTLMFGMDYHQVWNGDTLLAAQMPARIQRVVDQHNLLVDWHLRMHSLVSKLVQGQ